MSGVADCVFAPDVVSGPPTVVVEDHSFEEVRLFSWMCTRCGVSGSGSDRDRVTENGFAHLPVHDLEPLWLSVNSVSK